MRPFTKRLSTALTTAAAVLLISMPAAATTRTTEFGSTEHQSSDDEFENTVTPALISEFTTLRPGQTNYIAIDLGLKPKWHVYWPGQNDSGQAVEYELDLPEGFTALDPIWPTPERYIQPGDILDHVYHDRLTLIIPIQVPADTRLTEATINAEVFWLVCKEVCIPGDAELTLSLPVSSSTQTPAPHADHIEAARNRVPPPLPKTQTHLDILITDAGIRIAPKRPLTKLAFYPHETSATIENLIESGESNGTPLTLRTNDSSPIRGIVEAFTAPDEPSVIYEISVTPR